MVETVPNKIFETCDMVHNVVPTNHRLVPVYNTYSEKNLFQKFAETSE